MGYQVLSEYKYVEQALSRHVLWNKPTLQASIDDVNEQMKKLNY